MKDRKKKIIIIGGVSLLVTGGALILLDKFLVNESIKKGVIDGIEKVSKGGLSTILNNLGTGDSANRYVRYALSKYGIKIFK